MGDGTALFFLHAMITFLSVGIFSFVVAVVLARAAATAPIGYEDHAGFHEGIADGHDSGPNGRAVSRPTLETTEAPSLVAVR